MTAKKQYKNWLIRSTKLQHAIFKFFLKSVKLAKMELGEVCHWAVLHRQVMTGQLITKGLV